MRAVVDGVHGRDVGEERLRRADVGGGLVAADVLLAGLQGQPVAVAVVHVPVCKGEGRNSQPDTYATWYRTHLVTPTILPGMSRVYFSRVAKNPAWGPP